MLGKLELKQSKTQIQRSKQCAIFVMVNVSVSKILFVALLFFSTSAFANTNTVTSNTVSGTVTTIDKAPPTASAPPFSVMQSDSCAIPASIGIQSQVFGIATAKTFEDVDCSKRKYAKLLYQFGMKIAAVNVLCTDPIVFKAMERSGSPCPAGNGLIGQAAQDYWDANPEERADYEEWKKTKINVPQNDEPIDNEGIKNFALMALSMLLIL